MYLLVKNYSAPNNGWRLLVAAYIIGTNAVAGEETRQLKKEYKLKLLTWNHDTAHRAKTNNNNCLKMV